MTTLTRMLLASLVTLCGASACGRVGEQGAAQAPVLTRTVEVVMTTSMGELRVELYPDKAPLTVANFLRYVDERRYDGARFYRTVRADNDRNPEHPINVIQGGIEQGTALPPIAHETTLATGLRHTDGVISMARFTPGSASSEFFICLGDNPNLDFGAYRNADGQGFAAFGRVVAGMDVVRRIHGAPSNTPTDEPYVRGQILEEPVQIVRVRLEQHQE